MTAPILVFDSGVGGLTVLAEIQRLLPEAPTVFVADTAAFPYGRLADGALMARVDTVMDVLIRLIEPALVVIACNTASTLVLPGLRARYPIPFVGTVPAIKPAAAMTKSGLISVLATPGTVARDYTRGLIEQFAAGKQVNLVGSARLASLAEAQLRGAAVSDDEIAGEIAPAFIEVNGARTDVVVLACTHYPLLIPSFERLAPWPVTWLDSAPAIARRVKDVLPLKPEASEQPFHRAFITSAGEAETGFTPALAQFGVPGVGLIEIPFEMV